MNRFAVRLSAWIAITLTLLAGLAMDVVPTVNAGLADAVSLCTPADVHGAAVAHAPATPCAREVEPILVPRCGVA